MDLLSQWIQTVENTFKNGCPNGLLLNWDINRYFNSIKKICMNCKVINQTDFNYAYCNTYEIRPKTLAEKFIYELTLNISFIVNAYSLHWTRYSLDLKKGKVVPIAEVEIRHDPTDDLIEFMEKNNYNEMPSEWFDIQIKNIQLELAEKANLGKCLFHDYE